jgi:DNA-binding transcriptional LysR family regulator
MRLVPLCSSRRIRGFGDEEPKHRQEKDNPGFVGLYISNYQIMDILNCMRAFVAVADAGHFAVASERLGLSRAMASKQVMDLEAHLGLRLLNRTTRRVSLTEQGLTYLERCRDILTSIEEAEQEITSQSSTPVGRLRVSAPMSLGVSHVAPQVAAFSTLHPRVSIELFLNDRMIDLVEEGYDLAIRIGRLPDSSLVAKRIGEMQLICCASPAYLKTHGRPLTPEDLSRHECIQYSYASSAATWTFPGEKGETSVRVSGKVTANNGDAICQMGIRDFGVVLLPDFIVQPHLRSGALEEVLADYRPECAGVYAVYPSKRHIPAKLRSFVDHLEAVFHNDLETAASGTV